MDNPDGTGAQAEGGGTGGGLVSGAAGALLPLALGAASFMNPKAGSQMLQSLVPMLNLQMQEQAFGATERERKLTREQQVAKDERARRASLAAGGLFGLPPEVASDIPAGDVMRFGQMATTEARTARKEQLAEEQRREAGKMLGAPLSELFTPPQPEVEPDVVGEAPAFPARQPTTPAEQATVLQNQLNELRQRPMQVVGHGLPIPADVRTALTDRETALKERLAQLKPPKPTALLPKDLGQNITDALTIEVGQHPGATPAGVMAALESPDPVARREAVDILQKTQQRARQTALVQLAAEEKIKAQAQADALMLTEPAKARAVVQAQEFAQLGPKALDYIDPKTLQPPPSSMTIANANRLEAEKKLLIMPRGALGHQGLRELVDAVQLAYDAERLGKKIFTSDALVQFQQGRLALGYFFQTNPDTVVFRDMMKGRMFRLARGLGSDSRISDMDAEIVTSAIPGLTNFKATQEVFTKQMAEIKEIMVGGLKRYLALPPDVDIPALAAMQKYNPGDVDLLKRTLEAEKRRGR